MTCLHCGAQAPNDASFCGECGQSLQRAQPAQPEPAVAHAGAVHLAPPKPAVSDGLKFGIVAASLLIPLIGIVMGIVYLSSGGSEEKKSAGKLWLTAGLVMGVLWVLAGGGGY